MSLLLACRRLSRFLLVWPILATLGANASTPAEAAPPVWENQAVFRINKEEPHATKMPFPDAAGALAKPRSASPWHRSLNGEWRFHWVSTPHQRPVGFEQPGFDDAAWATLAVPSNVELHGYGTPIYTNIKYPFRKDAPRVMGEPPADWTTYRERNPVSSYRRTFTLPADWAGRQTFVVFNGVASAFHVYVNGRHVGYSQDSRTPAEFNLTAHLKPGENLLAVEVYRYSDGAYLEDQDYWRLSGIFRDVSLWSAASLDIRDFEADATLADDYRSGVLKLATWTRDYAGRERPYTVEAKLLDAGGRTLTRRTLSGRVPAGAEHTANVRIEGLSIEPWSAEQPRLYSLLLTLKDERGRAIAHYARKVGFRRAEVKNGNLLVNGKAILIKGVNRHDHNHLTGQYVTEASMRADLDAMKRLNINAIRTSHYPNDPRFLELVDEYGFYMVSEANIETHDYGTDPSNALANDPAWYPAQLDRVRNMVELLKNHPSVIVWSLGNESGDGPNFERLGKWVKQRDPSRPLHYEGAWERPYVDFISPMYLNVGNLAAWPRKEELKPLAEQRPLIMSEYNHTMGNSSGGLDEYWRVIRKERLLQGGFIWDWRDQGILREKPADHPLAAAQAAVSALDPERFVTPAGRLRYFAYGGDYGDQPNDNNFLFNGIVGADLVPNPHAVEVAHQYRNLLVKPMDLAAARPRVSVLNEHFFLTLDGQPYRWTVLEDGRPLHTGQGRLPRLAPQASAEIQLDLPDVPRRGGAEYHLNLEFLQGADRPWARADHVVAREQLPLAWAVPAAGTGAAAASSSPTPSPAANCWPARSTSTSGVRRTTTTVAATWSAPARPGAKPAPVPPSPPAATGAKAAITSSATSLPCPSAKPRPRLPTALPAMAGSASRWSCVPRARSCRASRASASAPRSRRSCANGRGSAAVPRRTTVTAARAIRSASGPATWPGCGSHTPSRRKRPTARACAGPPSSTPPAVACACAAPTRRCWRWAPIRSPRATWRTAAILRTSRCATWSPSTSPTRRWASAARTPGAPGPAGPKSCTPIATTASRSTLRRSRPDPLAARLSGGGNARRKPAVTRAAARSAFMMRVM
jgi:beta-galactosidase